MAVPDWLEGLGGALLGVNRGLSIAMDPYKAYEGVRAQTLQNDTGDVALRNFLAQQQARENPDLGYYGNEAAGKDALNRLALSKGNLDIFGQQQALAANEYLASEAFQQEVAQLDPRDPEYRQRVAAARAQYDPLGGIASYDAFKIPDLEQQNLKKQAILSYVTSYARTKDPGATAEFAADGTITVTASDGEEVKGLNPDIVLRAASMGSARDPAAPILAAINTQTNVQRGNADVQRAALTGRETPAQAYQYLNSVRVGQQAVWNRAKQAETTLDKELARDFQMDDEVKQEKRDRARKETDAAFKALQRTINEMKGMGKFAEYDAEVEAAAAAQAQAAAPPGGSAVTALPFGPRGAGAARAAGGGSGGQAPTSQGNLQPFLNQLLQGR